MTTTSSRTAHRAYVAALLAGLLLAACGSDDATSSTTTAPPTTAAGASTTTVDAGAGTTEAPVGDGCDLVSDAVVADVLGTAVTRREPHSTAVTESCIKGTDRANDPSATSYVSVSVTDGSAAMVDAAGADPSAASIDGLGDAAYFLTDAGALFVDDGGDAVQVQVVVAGSPGTQAQALAVATDVLDHR